MRAQSATDVSATADAPPPMLISSCLMAHDYDVAAGGTNAAPPRNPAFAVSITPLDSSGNVLGATYKDTAGNKALNYLSVCVIDEGDHIVPVVASYVDTNNQEQLVVLSHDEQYPTRFAVPASGICPIKVFGDLSLPQLMIFDDSHESTDAMLVSLGQDNTNYLGNLQAGDISAATDFSTPPQPILNSAFAGQEGNIATALQKIAGQSQPATAVRLGAAKRRHARWQPRAEDVGGFTITLTATTVSVGPAAASVGAGVGGFLSSLKDFYRRIVHGVEKVAKITFEAGSFIIETAEAAWKWAVHEMRAAVHAIMGFLKQVVRDVRQLAQWLSFLFDWGAIQNTAMDISNTLCTRMTRLIAWISYPGSTVSSDPPTANPLLRSHLQQWQDSSTLSDQLNSPPSVAAPALASQGSTYYPTAAASSGSGGASIASSLPFASQAPPSKPQPCGSDYTPHSTWLHGKLLGDSSFLPPSSIEGTRGLAAGDGPGSGFSQAIAKVLEDLKAIVAAVNPAQYPAWASFKQDLETLLQNPGKFTLQQLCDTLKQLCEVVAQVFVGVTEAIMATVAAVLSALKDLLETPLFSTSSFLGGLLKTVLGMEPTPLNLMALVIAIPVTLVGKVGNVVSGGGLPSGFGSAPQPVTGSGQFSTDMGLAAAFANVFLGLFTVIDDAGYKMIKPVSFLTGLASWGAILLAAPFADLLKPDSSDVATVTASVMLLLQTPPAIWSMVSVFGPMSAITLQEIAPLYTLYGGAMGILFVVAAGVNIKDDYLGFILPFTANEFSQLPNLGKVLCYVDSVVPEAGTAGVILCDCIGFGASFATGVLGAFIKT